MNRSRVNRYMDKLKSIQVRRQTDKAGGTRPRLTMPSRRKTSLLIVASVLACMVLTLAGTLARRPALSVTATDAVSPLGLLNAEQGKVLNAYAADGQPMKMPTTAAAESAPNSESTVRGPAGGVGNQAAQNWDRMIIRTATLQLKVKDVADSLDKVRSLAGTHGGYIASSDSHIEGEYTVATLTLQVPAAQFDDAMNDLRKVGVKAIGENVSSSDVTEEYTDLQSQLRNLQATEQRMQALMSRAERIEDILTLDRELRQIQSDIERIMGRTNYLSKRAEMSSITVTLYPEIAPVETVVTTEDGWNPGKIAADAWNASLEMLSNIATVAITVAVFMWWAVPLLLLALWLAVRPRKNTPVGTSPTPDTA